MYEFSCILTSHISFDQGFLFVSFSELFGKGHKLWQLPGSVEYRISRCTGQFRNGSQLP